VAGDPLMMPLIAIASSGSIYGDDMVFEITTNTTPQTIAITCQDVGVFNAVIDWGDSKPDSIITAYNDPDLEHIYDTIAPYTVRISGAFPNIYVNNNGTYKYRYTKLYQLGDTGLLTMERAFYGCLNLDAPAFENGVNNTSAATNMSYAFYDCTGMTTAPDTSGWDTSAVTDMTYTWRDCNSLTSPPDVSNWDTALVTHMSGMWYECESLTSPPDVSGWDTGEVIFMTRMFSDCRAMIDAPDVSDWDTSKCTGFAWMWYAALAMTSTPDVSLWETGAALTMEGMFDNMSKIVVPPDVSSWDVSAVTDMERIFQANLKITTAPDVALWDVSNVISFKDAFSGNPVMATAPAVAGWVTTSAESFYGIFYNTQVMPSVDISGWDVSSATNLDNLFFNAAGLSVAHYDATLIAWNAQSVNSGLEVHFGPSKYTNSGAALAARSDLEANPNLWNITDGGPA
jgi:surface protein